MLLDETIPLDPLEMALVMTLFMVFAHRLPVNHVYYRTTIDQKRLKSATFDCYYNHYHPIKVYKKPSLQKKQKLVVIILFLLDIQTKFCPCQILQSNIFIVLSKILLLKRKEDTTRLLQIT
jgi:hypothetical protein